MGTTQGTDRFGWLRQVGAAALAGAVAIVPLYFVLLNDRDLQRTELGIADQHAAYTDFLNAADAAVIPRYITWAHFEDESGQANPSDVDALHEEILRNIQDLFPDQSESARTFQESATRLRLVIPADDAHLISALSGTLSPKLGDRTPPELLSDYTNAKLALVNEFRSDVLGQDDLPDDEAHQMNRQTLENIRREVQLLPAASGAADALRDLSEPVEK